MVLSVLICNESVVLQVRAAYVKLTFFLSSSGAIFVLFARRSSVHLDWHEGTPESDTWLFGYTPSRASISR